MFIKSRIVVTSFGQKSYTSKNESLARSEKNWAAKSGIDSVENLITPEKVKKLWFCQIWPGRTRTRQNGQKTPLGPLFTEYTERKSAPEDVREAFFSAPEIFDFF